MSATAEIRLKLQLVCTERDEHMFFLHVEGPSSDIPLALVDGVMCLQPWLRPACSCGWVAKDHERFTLEENALYLWFQHLEGKV